MLRPRLNTAVWLLGAILASAALAPAGPDEKSARDEGDGDSTPKKVDVKAGDAKKAFPDKGEPKKTFPDKVEPKKAVAEKGDVKKGVEKADVKADVKKAADGKGGDLAARVEALERQVRDLGAFVKQHAADHPADGKKQPDKHDLEATYGIKKGDGKAADIKKGNGKHDADDDGHGKRRGQLVKGPDGQLLVPLSALPPGLQKQFLAGSGDQPDHGKGGPHKGDAKEGKESKEAKKTEAKAEAKKGPPAKGEKGDDDHAAPGKKGGRDKDDDDDDDHQGPKKGEKK